jgi:hypothetical protein
MYHSKSQVVHNVAPCVPWSCSRINIPRNVWGLAAKAERTAWMTDRNTSHCFYTVFEGQNNAQRVRQGGQEGAESENLPQFLHGIVADVDIPLSDEDMQKQIDLLVFKPNWVEKTLSDRWHLVFQFDHKIGLPPVFRVASDITKFICEKIGLFRLSQLDKGSWDPARRFCNSGRWMQVSEDDGSLVAPIQAKIVIGWASEVMHKSQCYQASDEDRIPLELIHEELKKRKDFQWDGTFELEAKGPSFWVPGSVSPKSAVVKAGGIYTFAEHASKTFWPWHDLVDKKFIAEHTAGREGAVLQSIYFDGQHYFQTDAHNSWQATTKDDLQQDLKTRGIYSSVQKGESSSELDDLMSKIRHQNRIVEVGPYAFRPSGIIEVNHQRKLNTFNRKLCPMHPEAVTWGQGFDRQIAPLTEWLFDQEQIERILSWLHWAYFGYARGKPETGQALIIVGPPDMGKSCWINEVVGNLLGGAVDASVYLMGDDSFGGELYSAACWTFEDTALGTNPQAREKMARRVKQFVANLKHRVHNKYAAPNYSEAAIRLVGSMNDDAQSLQQSIPLDASILDKLIYLHIRATKPFNFLGRYESSEIFREELPFFARFVHDWTIPAHLKGSMRYGVKAHIDSSLLPLLNNASTTAGLSQLLDAWAQEYFQANPQETEWVGDTLKLSQELAQDEVTARVVDVTVKTLSRALPELEPHLEFLKLRQEGKKQYWVLTPPAGMDRTPKPKKNPPTASA